jgi:hypothetical protein
MRKLYNESNSKDRARIIQAIDEASQRVQVKGHTFVAAIYRQVCNEIDQALVAA